MSSSGKIAEDQVSEWRAVGAGPVREAAPAGEPVRNDPLFEELQAEIKKLGSLSGVAVNWKEVIRLCREILKGKSKDLLVGSYLAFGLFQESGYTGLAAGLACIEGMVSSYWKTLHPDTERMQVRLNAIDWLSERAGRGVLGRAPEAADQEGIAAATERLRTLERVLYEKENRQITLGKLRDALQTQMEKLKSPAAGAASVIGGKELKGSSSIPLLQEIGSVEQGEKAADEAAGAIRKAAAFVRAQNPTTPWPYRAVRTAVWLRIDALPPNQNGKTRVPPPPPYLVERCRQLHEKGAWMELIEKVELEFHTAPFWIDSHRFAVQALAFLGPPYVKAKEAIVAEVMILLKRLPGLAGYEFSDGTPWADEGTRQWIEKELFSFQSGGVPSGEVDAASTSLAEGRFSEIRNKARALLEEGKVKEAVSLVQKEREGTAPPRMRFLMTWETAKLCLEAGYPHIALSLFEETEREIDRHSLEQWEPSLCLRIFRDEREALKQLTTGQPADSEWCRRSETIYRKICRLDPVLGVELKGLKKSGWFGRS